VEVSIFEHGLSRGVDVPCRQCRDGLHRICPNITPIPTLLVYLRGRKASTVETVTCCDRKEFWTRPVFE
jgi:hypothetical protein